MEIDTRSLLAPGHANDQVGFYRINAHRPAKAFEELVEDWNGILISDGYSLYENWINHRQTCIPHLIRRARGLAERKIANIKRYGEMMVELLQRLIHFAKEPPSDSEWSDFYQELIVALSQHVDVGDDACKMSRRVFSMLEDLFFSGC